MFRLLLEFYLLQHSLLLLFCVLCPFRQACTYKTYLEEKEFRSLSAQAAYEKNLEEVSLFSFEDA